MESREVYRERVQRTSQNVWETRNLLALIEEAGGGGAARGAGVIHY